MYNNADYFQSRNGPKICATPGAGEIVAVSRHLLQMANAWFKELKGSSTLYRCILVSMHQNNILIFTLSPLTFCRKNCPELFTPYFKPANRANEHLWMRRALIYLRLDLGGGNQMCSNATCPECVIGVMWSVIVSLEALSKIRALCDRQPCVCFSLRHDPPLSLSSSWQLFKLLTFSQHLKCRVWLSWCLDKCLGMAGKSRLLFVKLALGSLALKIIKKKCCSTTVFVIKSQSNMPSIKYFFNLYSVILQRELNLNLFTPLSGRYFQGWQPWKTYKHLLFHSDWIIYGPSSLQRCINLYSLGAAQASVWSLHILQFFKNEWSDQPHPQWLVRCADVLTEDIIWTFLHHFSRVRHKKNTIKGKVKVCTCIPLVRFGTRKLQTCSENADFLVENWENKGEV